MASAREAERFAHGLAHDRAAGVENACHHRSVDVWHITFEGRGAVHHRHAGHADVVLHHDAFACQWTVSGTTDFRLYGPRAERILAGTWPIARRARIAHRRQVIGQLRQAIVSL